MSDIFNKLWGFCHTLRHDGIDYGDYIEQLTYLLFLKMADEKGVAIPKNCSWETLKAPAGTALTDHCSCRDFTICDPACGTGGFLVCAYEWLMEATKGALERKDIKKIKTATYYGQELVPRPRRLALMNLFLHGIEARIYLGDSICEAERGEHYDCVLTNPPFGTKGANQAPDRDDFTIETSNEQLNFVEHVMNILKPGGRAAIVLPDNCLFEDKAGEF
jgi:type I restriction enzyme M protein